jgi:DNA-directed RNA polymerase beta' subunit
MMNTNINIKITGSGDGEESHERLLTGSKAFLILKRMDNKTYQSLGFDPIKSRPEDMMITVLPVPPPCVRPTTIMYGSISGEDDLTHKLAEIIRVFAFTFFSPCSSHFTFLLQGKRDTVGRPGARFSRARIDHE